MPEKHLSYFYDIANVGRFFYIYLKNVMIYNLYIYIFFVH